MIPLSKSITELTEIFEIHGMEVMAYTHGNINTASMPIACAINSGLCHVFAKLASLRHPEACLVGSPTHVFLKLDGLCYDASHPRGVDNLTKYPPPLLDYSSTQKLIHEFPTYIDALIAVSWLRRTTWEEQYQLLLREIHLTN